MKRLSLLPLMAFVALLAAGCGDDQGPETDDALSLDDLVGSWIAISQVYVNNANGTQQFDLVAAGGETRVTVLSDGRARTWTTLGDFSDEFDAQLSLSGSTVTSTPAEASRGVKTYTVTIEEGVVTMVNSAETFDFTLSGEPGVPATLTVKLVAN